MDMLGVERFEVAIKELAGHDFIEWLLQIVVIGEHVGRGGGDLAVDRARSYRVEDVRGEGGSGREGRLISHCRWHDRLGRNQRHGQVKAQD